VGESGFGTEGRQCLHSRQRAHIESGAGIANNQNYGLRLWDSGGFLRPSFLFRSRKDGDHAGDWHRWTTTGGIATGSGWHHVAVTYEFGKPETIRGYIDGELAPGAGTWAARRSRLRWWTMTRSGSARRWAKRRA
jgi:hypothetical protein